MVKRKILIVEDEVIIAMELAHRLNNSGFDVLPHALNGEDAVRKARELMPDLILMDVELGKGINGIEAARRINAKLDIPIVYLTAYADQNTINEAKYTGPFGYLVKPFEQKDLETTIEVALYKHSTEKILKDNEKWLDTTLNNVDDGILSVNTNDKINFINKTAEKILGVNKKSILDISIWKAFRVSDFKNIDEHNNFGSEIFLSQLEEMSNREMILFNSDGSKIAVEISISSLKNDKNNPIGFVIVFRDISSRKKSEAAINHRMEFEKFLSSLSSNFINLPHEEIDEEINKALETVGKLTNASRVFIFTILEDHNAATKSYEWIADGVASNKESFQNMPMIKYPWILSKMINDESLHIKDISEIPRIAKSEREIWEKEKIKSFIAAPLKSKNKLMGLFGISSLESSDIFKDEDLHLIKTTGEIIYNTLERKKFEHQLITGEEQYRTVFENISDGIIYYDFISKKVIKTNLAYQKLSGYSADELMNLRSFDLVANDHNSIYEFDKLLKKHGNYFLGERMHRRKNGSLFPVEVSASLINLRGREALVVVVRDITERKKNEIAISESEKKYRTLFEMMAQGVVFQNPNGKIISANPAACQILGLTSDKLTSASSYDEHWKAVKEDGTEFKGEEHPAIVAVKTGKPVHDVIMGICNPKEKKRKWIVVNAVPQFHENEEQPFGVFATFTDISERKITEEILKKSERELKQLNATKDKFFSIVSHDLRSPFQGLLGASNFVHENFDELDNKELKKFLKNIADSTKNIYSLIEQLLDWSRLQSGHFEFKPQKLDLQQNVLYVISLMEPIARAKNITVENRIFSSESIYTDERMLNSVLENLISNAVKFTNPEGKIITSAIPKNNLIEICVRDTGVGISSDKISLLFKIDNNFSTRGTSDEDGTGLGLILCKDMVEKWGGEIWVESEVNEGSSFYFTVPKNGTS